MELGKAHATGDAILKINQNPKQAAKHYEDLIQLCQKQPELVKDKPAYFMAYFNAVVWLRTHYLKEKDGAKAIALLKNVMEFTRREQLSIPVEPSVENLETLSVRDQPKAVNSALYDYLSAILTHINPMNKNAYGVVLRSKGG